MQTRFRCPGCLREWVYATTAGDACPACGRQGVETVVFEALMLGLDSTTTESDLPSAPSEVPALAPVTAPPPETTSPPLVLAITPAYQLDLGERL